MSFAVATLTVLATSAAPLPAADGAAARGPTIACQANDRNLQTYQQIHKILFMDRDASRVGEFYAPEVISHNQDSGGSTTFKVKSAQMGAMWTASKRNNPERVLADDLIVCANDYVIVRTMIHSSDRIGIDGNPPTGKPYVISGIDIYRFENGKVVERWGNADLVSMYQQIGYSLTPPTVKAAVAIPAASAAPVAPAAPRAAAPGR